MGRGGLCLVITRCITPPQPRVFFSKPLPFSIVQQFTDLSSLDTKNMIKEAYSGVSGIYMFQNTETGEYILALLLASSPNGIVPCRSLLLDTEK